MQRSALVDTADALRGRAWGPAVTFSPKVFLPVTNLCRNRCDYCSFRRDPGAPGEWTMTPAQVIAALDAGGRAGCREALLCLGDVPESAFPAYHDLLRDWGFASTVAYLAWIGRQALDRGLLPHTNAGVLDSSGLATLRPVNASMGLMLETVADRLCAPPGPHARAPDKRPERRLAMIEEAGRQRIPFTTGLLVGIGETEPERRATLEAIAALHRSWGHIQEVIVQPFRVGPELAGSWAVHPEPDDADLVHTVALARTLLPPEVSVQVPPNLASHLLEQVLAAGANDLGGISPVTPDYINPAHAWPHLSALTERLASWGRPLRPRLPVYPAWTGQPWQDPALQPHLQPARMPA